MKRPVTIDDILNSVDFELLQGVLPQDELGQGIARLRSYQNEQRSALFGAGSTAPTLDDVADLQLRLNDAMLTLIQVLGARFDGLGEQVRRAEYLQLRLDETAPFTAASSSMRTSAGGLYQPQHIMDDGSTPHLSAAGDLESAIQASMRPDSLDQWLDVRPVNIPLIGGLLTRLRRSLHELVLFYVRRLADEQMKVNHVYGNALLTLDQAVRVQNSLLQPAAAQVDDAPLSQE